MFGKWSSSFRKIGVCFLLLLMVGMFTACGQKQTKNIEQAKTQSADTKKEESKESERFEIITEEDEKREEKDKKASQSGRESTAEGTITQKDMAEGEMAGDNASEENVTEQNPAEKVTEEAAKADVMRAQFGENCIAEQTFEIGMSEYRGKVYFVPFAPAEPDAEFRMQMIQDGKVLTEIPAYVPEQLSGEKFSSLDAVSFYDVNYDGNTDIVLIETYGNTRFAAIYYGYGGDTEYDMTYFVVQERLSEAVSSQAEEISISGIRNLLTSGKKNGKFSSYQEAYRAVSKLCRLEGVTEDGYNLIYFDEDEVPELVSGSNGYYVSLYTYHDGTIYTLMDRWGYGVMGNAGYEYAPRKNNLRNDNADYAGAIVYTTYMKIGANHSMETVAQIETYNFDDVNKNGFPDENETDSLGKYSVSYIDGREMTAQEWESYDAGEYVFIEGAMNFETLQAKLK